MLLSEFTAYPRQRDRLEAEVKAILNTLDRQASRFIRSMKQADMYLYRGFSSNLPTITRSSLPNREPRGQSFDQQFKLDYIFKTAGFKSLRSNSVCCTPDINQIDEFGFGMAYFMFPHNGFSFTWSRRIEDVGSSEMLVSTLNDVTQEELEDYPGYCANFIKDFEFSNTSMEHALATGNEITINGKYTAISVYFRDIIVEHFGIWEGA